MKPEKPELPRAAYSTFNDGVHIPTRTVTLGFNNNLGETDLGELDGYSVEKFIQGVHILETANSQSLINVKMMCIGGDVRLGLAIYDAIRYSKCPVHVIVYGQCLSMGVAILQAADKRILMPNSTLMIHAGTLGVSESHPREVESEMRENRRLDRLYCELLMERTGHSLQEIEEMCTFAKYMDSKEALNLNFADEIVGRGKKKKSRTK